MFDKLTGAVLISIAFIIGAAISFVAYDLYSKQLRSAHFLAVEAIVTKSQIVSKTVTRGRDARHKDITFEYIVNGKKYSSNIWSFFRDDNSKLENFGDHILSHPVGRKFTAFYDPSNPEIAVVDKSPPDITYTYVVAILLAGFVSFILFCAQQMFFSTNILDIDSARKIKSFQGQRVARKIASR